MDFARLAVRNRLIFGIVMVSIALAGIDAYRNMARFEDPEFIIRTAVVTTSYPGATAEEVANEVTEALESAVQSLEEVEKVTSTSTLGMSIVQVDINYRFSRTRADLDVVWGKLRNRIRDAQAMLPPGAMEPVVNDSFGDVYGLSYFITGEGFSLRELYDYARDLRTELLSVRDVGKVAILGQRAQAIYIEVARDRAAALGVSLESVYDDLAQRNSVTPAGNLRVGDRRMAILPSGSVDSVDAIRDVVVSPSGGDALIRLGDIASVSRGYVDPPQQIVRYMGQPAIALGIASVTGTNVAQMGAAIDRRILETTAHRPLGVEVHEFYHQGKVVTAAVSDFVLNVAAALVIVLVTLLVFMGLRPAVVIGAVLLLTVAATLMVMRLTDIPMHRISLGALIIALGMLVDNAIVVTEGILVAVRGGRNKLAAASEVVRRTRWPLLGGTAVGIIAFAPIGLASGDTAEYTGDLFRVILISLLFSWLFAITAAPMLADLLLPTDSGRRSLPDGRFQSLYKALVTTVLSRRWLTLGAAAVLFWAAIAGFAYVKEGFFPSSTTPQVAVDYWLPEGADIARTRDDMIVLERRVASLDGVEAVQTLVGAGGLRHMLVYAPESPNPSYGQLLIRVDNYRRLDELLPRIRAMLDEHHPDAQAKVWRFQLGPGGGSKIEAEFAGPNPSVLRRLANEAKAIMAADGGAVAIRDDWREPVSYIEPRYADARARRLGVSREDVAEALESTYSGRTVGVFRDGDTLMPIIARAPANERRNTASLGAVQIPNRVTGGVTPMLAVIDGVGTNWRNGRIKRVDRVFAITAQCDPVAGEAPSELLARLRPRIEAIELPPGYRLEWRGEYGDSAEAQASLASALPLSLASMVLVVVALFNAVRQPMIIYLLTPLALVGVVLGLLVTNTALEFMALLGLLALSGLLIKNAIVLIDQMDYEIDSGKPRLDAVIDSAASRVRPVAMGALTTVLGVTPLFFDAFFHSMAVVLVFGLSFATLLILVVAPVMYAVFFRIGDGERAGALDSAGD